MKYLFSLLIALLIVNFANAQWKTLNSGTTKNLNDTYFLNSNLGYAVGDLGTIIKTTNGGATWNTQNSNVILKLSSVFFTDSSNGYIVGDSALLLKTTNGGLNWVKQTLGISSSVSFNKIYFSTDSFGYITSNSFETISNSSIMLRTINKGLNWVIDTFGIGVTSSTFFSSKDTGYIVGNCIRKTTNGGIDWQSQSFNNISLNGVTHNGYSNTIVAAGDSGKIVYGTPTTPIFSVTNPGTTENLKFIIYDSYYHFYFAVGDKGTIFRNKDTDPLTKWTACTSGVTCNLNNISTIEQSNYSSIIVGDSGTILKSTNYGDTWVKINSGYVNNLNAFAGEHGSNESGFIVGDSGLILRLYNTTVTRVQNGLTNRKLNYICFNGSTYYMVGEKGTIIRATNSFNTFTKQYVDSTIDLNYVHFYTANGNQTTSGYACGFDHARNESVILYTSNGGVNWNRNYTGFKTKLKKGDDQNHYIAGEAGTILFPTQANYPTSYNFKYWVQYNTLPFDPSGSVFFTNSKIGFAANRSSNLFKTTDGGNSWSSISVNNIRSIFFTDTLIGYTVGSAGNLKKTTNLGTSWTTQTSGTTNDLNKLYFPNINAGYAVGNNGTIIKIWSITVNNAIICQGDSATLKATGDGISYTWSNGETGSTIKVAPNTTTTFTVNGVSADGSSDIKTCTVTVIPKPNVTIAIDTPSINPGHSATLCASGAISYTWNTGQTTSCITVSPTATTTYTVIGANNCGLDTAIGVVTIKGTAVEEINKEDYKIFIFPIPVSDKLTIESSQLIKGNLFVYNLSGQELLKQQINDSKMELNISNLTSGIYFVKLVTDKRIEVRKIIKE